MNCFLSRFWIANLVQIKCWFFKLIICIVWIVAWLRQHFFKNVCTYKHGMHIKENMFGYFHSKAQSRFSCMKSYNFTFSFITSIKMNQNSFHKCLNMDFSSHIIMNLIWTHAFTKCFLKKKGCRVMLPFRVLFFLR